MRISQVKVENFRCLSNVEITVDDLTVLIGANGTGKSSVLRALNWFFEGGALEVEDICGKREDAQITVGVTFCDITQADREKLGSYAMGETATFWRNWSLEEGERLTGRVLAYAPFEKVRNLGTATDRRSAYASLSREDASLELPSVRSDSAAKQAMQEWEAENLDKLEPAITPANHLFVSSGQPRFAGRFDYVFVSAVADAEEQTGHTSGALMKQVIKRSPINQEQTEERLKELHANTMQQVRVSCRRSTGKS